MRIRWTGLSAYLMMGLILVFLVHAAQAWAQNDPPANTPVFRSTTTLVYLDVTVVDKKGKPIVTGLTKDDFSITEDKQPQRIFSFEAPEEHGRDSAATANGKSPQVIVVLDFLNARFEEFSYIRDQVRAYLEVQPEELHEPTALMVSGNQSLDMLQGYTRSRSDLLFALDHLPPMEASKFLFTDDRLRQSYVALTQIAIQNKGVPGRKLVIWVGPGGLGLNTEDLSNKTGDMVKRYIHHTINMLVEDRISLYLVRVGLSTNLKTLSKRERDGTREGAESDALTSSRIHFTDFVDGTGGKTFNLNNLATELGESVALGSDYYTLTYQPRETEPDGSFRRVQVRVRNPNLQAITKVGYFAPESKEIAQSDDSIVDNLTEAAMATMPFNALDLKVTRVVRHPDARSVEITLEVADKNLAWQATDGGQSSATVIVTGVSRSVSHLGREDVLASRVAKFYLRAGSQDPVKLAEAKPKVRLILPYPKQTKNVRVALAANDGARIGAVDIDKKTIDAAPETPSPQPRLSRRIAATPSLRSPSR